MPEALIDYADAYIDFTDIPEVNEESLEDGTYRMTLPVALDYEVYQWIRRNNINYNAMINGMLKTVIHSVPQSKTDDTGNQG